MKMIRSPWPGHLTSAVLAATLLMGTACDKSAKTVDPVKDTTAEATAPDKATETGSKPDDALCTKYKDAFCEAAGAQSQSCQSMTLLSDLLPPSACEAGIKDIAFTKERIAGMSKKCDELVAKLCADLGAETESCKMVKERTPQFPPEQCATMMGQYDQVLAGLKAEEEKNKPLSPEMTTAIAAADAASFGPADAKVTVVEFSDFECPYCTRAATAVDQLKKDFKGKSVRVVFRHFPLSFHPNAHLTAQASLAANEQGKFWEFHDLVFQNQKALTRPDLEKYASEAGLNMAKFKAALDSEKFKKQVDDDMALGQKVYVQGTPTMFINGVRVPNPTDANAIKPMIESRL